VIPMIPMTKASTTATLGINPTEIPLARIGLAPTDLHVDFTGISLAFASRATLVGLASAVLPLHYRGIIWTLQGTILILDIFSVLCKTFTLRVQAGNHCRPNLISVPSKYQACTRLVRSEFPIRVAKCHIGFVPRSKRASKESNFLNLPRTLARGFCQPKRHNSPGLSRVCGPRYNLPGLVVLSVWL
jgi:hypothetical protein